MVAPRETSVFVNCPFDPDYKPLFDAIVFTIASCGFDPRSAMEEEDSANLRLEKIIVLLKASRFSIHDISRVETDPASGLPRFNMPLELGAAIGLRAGGTAPLDDHQVLILDTEQFRYQKFVSDLAGVDIRGHDNKVAKAVAAVRNFLGSKRDDHVLGPAAILTAYRLFERSLPALAKAKKQKRSELTYHDRMLHMTAFMDQYR